MPIEKPKYNEFAQAPGDSAIKELEMMKIKDRLANIRC